MFFKTNDRTGALKGPIRFQLEPAPPLAPPLSPPLAPPLSAPLAHMNNRYGWNNLNKYEPWSHSTVLARANNLSIMNNLSWWYISWMPYEEPTSERHVWRRFHFARLHLWEPAAGDVHRLCTTGLLLLHICHVVLKWMSEWENIYSPDELSGKSLALFALCHQIDAAWLVNV